MRTNLVLTFHNVTDECWFEKVIVFLKSKYKIIDLDSLEAVFLKGTKSGNLCHITFDDGEESFYKIAFPILKKYNVQATIFVSPFIITSGYNFWFQEVSDYDEKVFKRIISVELSIPIEFLQTISYLSILKCLSISEIDKLISIYQEQTKSKRKKSQNMSLSQILEVHNSGLVAIGAHTLTHPILSNESNETSYYEISNSIEMLRKLLGTDIRHFAYPNGIPDLDFGKREIVYLKELNISMAFSSESSFLSSVNDIYSIPRVGLSYGNIRFIKLKLLLGDKWDSIKSILKSTEIKNRKLISLLLNGK